jgi:hypothetical protein
VTRGPRLSVGRGAAVVIAYLLGCGGGTSRGARVLRNCTRRETVFTTTSRKIFFCERSVMAGRDR